MQRPTHTRALREPVAFPFSFSLSLLFCFAAPSIGSAPPARAQSSALTAGHYVLQGTAADGRQFGATLHITRVDDAFGGRVVSTFTTPLPVRQVTVANDTLSVVAELTPTRLLRIHLRLLGDSVDGAFTDGATHGTFRGHRGPAAAGDPNDLPPSPCRVAGLGEIARCATHWVYENRPAQRGRRIPLNIVILPALATPREPDALFHLAGGPGQAATQQAAGNAQRFAAIRQRRDIVMIDQRGTGGSNGLTCAFAGARERAALLLGGTFDSAATVACRADLASRADLSQYHTAAFVEDVEAVRAWLRYDRINLYGGSYGTRAALEYVRRYPARVRTATLRAVVATGTSSVLESALGAQRGLEQVFSACAQEAACAAEFPSLRAQWAAVLARADSGSVSLRVFDAGRRDSVDVRLTRGVLASSVRRLLMDAETIRGVPLAIDEMFGGNWTAMAVGLSRTLGVGGEISWGMALSVHCAEEPPIIRRVGVGTVASTFIGTDQANALLRICPAWGAGAPPPEYDTPVRAGTQVLLISGEFDPATPPAMGEAVARTLPNALHAVLPGASHAQFPACATDLMTRFVDTGRSAGLDTSCVRQLTRAPFLLRTAAR